LKSQIRMTVSATTDRVDNETVVVELRIQLPNTKPVSSLAIAMRVSADGGAVRVDRPIIHFDHTHYLWPNNTNNELVITWIFPEFLDKHKVATNLEMSHPRNWTIGIDATLALTMTTVFGELDFDPHLYSGKYFHSFIFLECLIFVVPK
jgi:hypothetical protein